MVSASSGVRQAPHEHSHDPMRVLIVAPALEAGAADAGAVELTRILKHAGHHAIVVSNVGRLVADINAAGAEFVPLDAEADTIGKSRTSERAPSSKAAQRKRSPSEKGPCGSGRQLSRDRSDV